MQNTNGRSKRRQLESIDLSQFSHRVTRITLFHLDGTTSNMKFMMPVTTAWGEMQETATVYLQALVENLTRTWIKIRGFQIAMGSIYQNGEEIYSSYYAPVEIPLNKVFIPPIELGRWVTLEERQKAEKETKYELVRHQAMKASMCFLN